MKDFLVSVIQTFNMNWDEKNISAPFVILFLFGIYYIYRTKKKDIKEIFVYPVLIYGITIFNPLIHWILIWKMGFSGRSHRFFWVIPMVFVLSWLAAEIIFRMKSQGKRLTLFLALVGMCIFAGRPMYYEEHFRTENIYKVTDETLEISNKLKEIEGEREKIVIINDHNINYFIRQYDPSICLIAEPHDIEIWEQISEIDYECNLQKSANDIVTGYFHNHYRTEVSEIRTALRETNAEYLVLDYEEDTLEKMNYIEQVTACGRFNIYKVL